MIMSNSPLVVYTKLSPNHSGKRKNTISRISPHCVVGQVTAESLGNWFSKTSVQASSNYGIDKNGRIGMYIEEKNRSWCTSSSANDNRAVTIECASDTKHPYAMNTKVYNSLIDLCVDICKRNGKTKLLWFNDKAKTLNYEPKSDEMIITVHRWFDNKACPGDWLYSRLGDLASKVTARLTGKEETKKEEKTVNIELNTLRRGSKGEQVKTIQRILYIRGWKDGNGKALKIDGSFGPATEYAVKSFQKGKNITADGIVGEKTWSKLLKG